MPFLLAISLFLLSPVLSAKQDLHLTVNTQVASEGYISLSWNELASSDSMITLEVARDPSFSPLVRRVQLKDQSQVHLSGFSDGDYYARLIVDGTEAQSPPISFRVQHRSLTAAWWLFGLGFVLFTLLVGLVFNFTRPQQQSNPKQ